MSTIPDFNSSELWIIRTTLKERYGWEIELQLADSEVKFEPSALDTIQCPTAYREAESVSFVILKTAPERYRCQFFYSEEEQYGTGIQEYDNISECATTLLQVQADHEGNKNLQSQISG